MATPKRPGKGADRKNRSETGQIPQSDHDRDLSNADRNPTHDLERGEDYVADENNPMTEDMKRSRDEAREFQANEAKRK